MPEATTSCRAQIGYYESQFVDSMPDLNLQSEAVRGEIDKVTSFWLDRGVDGFRLDAVIYYNNNNQTETIDDLTWLVNNVKSKKGRCLYGW